MAQPSGNLVQHLVATIPARASFNSPQQVREAIDQFIAAYNEQAEPFQWRKTEVHPTRLKHSYADLCK